MVRRTNYNGSQKSITAATVQTLTWTPAEIPSERVVAYHLTLQGAGNDLSDISRIRISANGQNIINVTPTQLRAFLQSFSGGRLKYPTTAQTITIPFCLLDAPLPDMADVCQFPARSQAQVEIVTAGTVAAGVAILGWTETTIAPALYPRLLASVLNVPASASLQRYNIQENGIVRGIQIPHTGVSRAKFTIAGQDYTFLPGPQFNGLANLGDMLFEAESLYGDGPGSAGTPLSTDPFSRITAGKQAPIDQSYVELETGAGWAGVSNEVCVYATAENSPTT